MCLNSPTGIQFIRSTQPATRVGRNSLATPIGALSYWNSFAAVFFQDTDLGNSEEYIDGIDTYLSLL